MREIVPKFIELVTSADATVRFTNIKKDEDILNIVSIVNC